MQSNSSYAGALTLRLNPQSGPHQSTPVGRHPYRAADGLFTLFSTLVHQRGLYQITGPTRAKKNKPQLRRGMVWQPPTCPSTHGPATTLKSFLTPLSSSSDSNRLIGLRSVVVVINVRKRGCLSVRSTREPTPRGRSCQNPAVSSSVKPGGVASLECVRQPSALWDVCRRLEGWWPRRTQPLLDRIERFHRWPAQSLHAPFLPRRASGNLHGTPPVVYSADDLTKGPSSLGEFSE